MPPGDFELALNHVLHIPDAFMGEQVQHGSLVQAAHEHRKALFKRSELGAAEAAGAAVVWAKGLVGLAVVVLAEVAEVGALPEEAEAAELRAPRCTRAALTCTWGHGLRSNRDEGAYSQHRSSG